MITFDSFTFAAPPHTGVSWFMEAARQVGQQAQFQHDWQCHTPFHEGVPGFSVSLIRHPYTWLQALYFNHAENYVGVPQEVLWFVQEAQRAEHFQTFINRVLDRPGCVGSMFGAYRASSVLRIEDFPWAGMSLFELIGAPAEKVNALRSFHSDFVLGLPPADRTCQLRRLIVKSESAFSEQYEYY